MKHNLDDELTPSKANIVEFERKRNEVRFMRLQFYRERTSTCTVTVCDGALNDFCISAGILFVQIILFLNFINL